MTTAVLIPALEALEGGVQVEEIPQFIVVCVLGIMGAVAVASAWKMYTEGLSAW
jgi:hypothetical protein